MPRSKKKNSGGGNHGGPRTGTPGRAYGQRTDLNAGSAPTPNVPSQPRGLPYGEASRRESSQRSLPLPSAGDPATLPSLSGPSQRPSEPVTAGLGIGAGPGPEATVMGGGSPNESVLDFLQMLFNEFPTPELQRYIELAQQAATPAMAPVDNSFRPRTLPASDRENPLIPNMTYRTGGQPLLKQGVPMEVNQPFGPDVKPPDPNTAPLTPVGPPPKPGREVAP